MFSEGRVQLSFLMPPGWHWLQLEPLPLREVRGSAAAYRGSAVVAQRFFFLTESWSVLIWSWSFSRFRGFTLSPLEPGHLWSCLPLVLKVSALERPGFLEESSF